MPKGDRRRQKMGYMLGLVIGLGCLIILVLPGQENFHMSGPMNTGHQELTCRTCHQPAPGTTRQQMQANARYLLGLRATPVDFGHKPVTNAMCLACHQRPNDRHPVFRFFEPRFAETRKHFQPQFCTTCHREHSGRRVTLSQTTFCLHCHTKIEMKQDPLPITHEQLILANRWESCLRCHDFHGNHVMITPTIIDEAPPVEQIQIYFAGSSSPYSARKFFKAQYEVSRG
jgi:hypothetical protein